LQRHLAPQIFFLPKTLVPYGIPFYWMGNTLHWISGMYPC
jgi:hypothetical protein